MRRRLVLAALAVGLAGCDSKPAAPAPAPAPAKGEAVGPVPRVRQEVPKAYEAGQQRNDDALDAAMKGEAAGRGSPGR